METSQPRLCAPPVQACLLCFLWYSVLCRLHLRPARPRSSPGAQEPLCGALRSHGSRPLQACNQDMLQTVPHAVCRDALARHLPYIILLQPCRTASMQIQHLPHAACQTRPQTPSLPPCLCSQQNHTTAGQQTCLHAAGNTCHLGSQHPARSIQECDLPGPPFSKHITDNSDTSLQVPRPLCPGNFWNNTAFRCPTPCPTTTTPGD